MERDRNHQAEREVNYKEIEKRRGGKRSQRESGRVSNKREKRRERSTADSEQMSK